MYLRLGKVDKAVEVWERCLDYYRGEEDLARIGDLHRKIGAGLWQKGDREGSISNYQRGIDLLKDGPPSLELVRLYEEAASLYMHTGDNMLAIYASEKALRLAERLEESRRREPRTRDLRPRLRPHRRLRARPPEPRALGRARARDRSRRGGQGATRAGLPSRGLRGRLPGRDRRLRRGARARRADRRRPLAGRASGLARNGRRAPRRVGQGRVAHGDGRRPGRARGPDRQALLPPPASRRPAPAQRRRRGRDPLAAALGRDGRERRPLRGDGPGPALALRRLARGGHVRRLRPGAGDLARRLRAGRASSHSRSSARPPGR